MDLEELKKRLYEKEAKLTDRPQSPPEFKLGQTNINPAAPTTTAWEEEKPAPAFRLTKKFILGAVGAAVFLVLAGLGAWYFWSLNASFNKNKIYLEIFGPEKIVSGEESTYIVKYRNNTNSALNNFTLTFVYPDQSIPSGGQPVASAGGHQQTTVNLNQLGRGAEGQQEFKAKVWGEKGSVQGFGARVSYQPANFNSQFTNETGFRTLVSSSPLVLNFDLPQKITSGQTVNFSLQYINTSDTDFSGLKIKIDYPDGFDFKSSLPGASSESNLWPIDQLSGHAEGKIVINGIISGHEGENKTFRAMLGVEKDGQFIAYDQTASSPEIIASPLAVTLSSDAQNNRADFGERLNYKIKYKNTANETIGPVTIKVKIDGLAADFSKIDATSGFFSSADGAIVWNASSFDALNSLSAGQEGEFLFSLTLKSRLPVNSFNDKNFVVKATAQIDSPNIPLSLMGTRLSGQDELAVKINSPITFYSKAYYHDNLLPNTGPLPPRVGQQTTYTAHWEILNLSNDLSDVRVESSLPPYMQWIGKISPAGENVKYDQASGKIVWTIGRLGAATGQLLPVKTVAFQVALIPAANQVGQIATLIKPSVLYAHDTFTDAQQQISADKVDSNLPDEKQMNWNLGIIVN